jgi:hypothetical protein
MVPHFYPLWFAQSSPLLAYIGEPKERHYIFMSKLFILRSFKSLNFFFFLLDIDPIKMGPHLINRINNHRHKCVWASPTIFSEIYGWAKGQREREKKEKKWSNILV